MYIAQTNPNLNGRFLWSYWCME